MKVACYADDAKEPELIGEVTVGIDEVLKKGEVDGECSVLSLAVDVKADMQNGMNLRIRTSTVGRSTWS